MYALTFNTSDIKGALADYNRAIALNSKYATAYINRANLKEVRFKDYSGALADYNRGIQLDTNLAAAYYNRGELQQRIKNYSAALADYNRAKLARRLRRSNSISIMLMPMAIVAI